MIVAFRLFPKNYGANIAAPCAAIFGRLCPVHSPVIGKWSNSTKAAFLKIAAYGALLLLLMWPAIYNGQPLFSPDTSAYIRGFDAGVSWLSGRTTAWTTWAAKLPRQKASDNSTTERAHSFQSPEFIIAEMQLSMVLCFM